MHDATSKKSKNRHSKYCSDDKYFKSSEENIASQAYNDEASRRILSVLNKIALTKGYYIGSLQDEWLDKRFKKVSSNSVIKIRLKVAIMEDSIKNDFQNAFLFFLQQSIDGIKNKKTKQNLIKAKYILTFENKDIEKRLINNNFYIEDYISVESQITSELCGATKLYDSMKKNFIGRVLKEQIDNLNSIENKEYDDIDMASEAIIRDSFIKAALVLSSEKDIERAKASYESSVSAKGVENTQNFTISEGIIVFALTNAIKSKEKAVVYSLKR